MRHIARLSIVSLLLMAGCGQAAPVRLHVGETMGTAYHIKTVPGAGAPAYDAVDAKIRALLERFDALLSAWRADSELSRFNAAPAHAPFAVSPETIEVFQMAQRVSEESGGAFDITVAPLVQAWGFGPRPSATPPDDAALEALRERVGWRNVAIDAARGTLTKRREGVECDVSALAPGFAADLIARMFDAIGLAHYMIEIGGEVRAQGLNPEGKPWRIGIERPSAEARNVQRVVPLDHRSLATSGDYREFVEHDGKRYSHTIDLRTGRPALHALASISVLHESCGYADAYATAIMALGPEDGLALAQRLGLPAYFILHDGNGGYREVATPAFAAIAKQ